MLADFVERFEWDDEFQRYEVAITGSALVEYCNDTVIGRATLQRAPEQDGAVYIEDSGLIVSDCRRYFTDGTTAWIDHQAYKLSWDQ